MYMRQDCSCYPFLKKHFLNMGLCMHEGYAMEADMFCMVACFGEWVSPVCHPHILPWHGAYQANHGLH